MPDISLLWFLLGELVDSAIAGKARAQSIVVGALARIGNADDTWVTSSSVAAPKENP